MPSVKIQCHVRLELERLALLSRIQASDRVRATEGLDPSDQELAHQMCVKLRRVESALHQLAQDAFGLCQTCHQRIDDERLLALPDADLCIDCQRELERTSIKRYRMRQTFKAAA
jgi:DnaK suppressor protein